MNWMMGIRTISRKRGMTGLLARAVLASVIMSSVTYSGIARIPIIIHVYTRWSSRSIGSIWNWESEVCSAKNYVKKEGSRGKSKRRDDVRIRDHGEDETKKANWRLRGESGGKCSTKMGRSIKRKSLTILQYNITIRGNKQSKNYRLWFK